MDIKEYTDGMTAAATAGAMSALWQEVEPCTLNLTNDGGDYSTVFSWRLHVWSQGWPPSGEVLASYDTATDPVVTLTDAQVLVDTYLHNSLSTARTSIWAGLLAGPNTTSLDFFIIDPLWRDA